MMVVVLLLFLVVGDWYRFFISLFGYVETETGVSVLEEMRFFPSSTKLS